MLSLTITDTPMLITVYIFIFLFGIVIGSFVNVCIYRIPLKENIVTERSHCMSCRTGLKWYELIPLFSWLLQGGRCRTCKAPISVQYPLIEAANGILYVIVTAVNGLGMESLLYCLLASALLTLSVIDLRTYEIPLGINLFILALGLIRAALDYHNWATYVIGFFAVSVFLEIIVLLSRGRAMGGGDVKLMAVCGLLLGWKLILPAFLTGCVLGAVIHSVRMLVSKESHVLAMGPYLSMGVMLAALFGNAWIDWYIGLLL